jgi:hypothetical protein
MKHTKYIIGLLALLATFTASATVIVSYSDDNFFALGSTNKANQLSYAVVSQRSANGGAPAIRALNAGSAMATAVVQFYKVTAQATVTHTNSTTTLFVNNTNGFSSGASDVIIIRHNADDSYEKRILQSSGQSASTNLSVTVAPVGTVVPGDQIYRCSTTTAEKALAGTIFWGASTNTLSAGGAPIYVGQPGLPLLLEINSSGSDASINVVAGDYVR